VHVLVVDDNAGVRDALTFLFRIHGIEARSAATPDEAVAAAADDDVGVLIQDMNFHASATSGEGKVCTYVSSTQIVDCGAE
jgi:FixJ family two-component response regulator